MEIMNEKIIILLNKLQRGEDMKAWHVWVELRLN